MRVFDPARVSALILGLASFITANASASVTLWDTMKDDRAHWKKVPSNLMDLEKEPLKAASDPGYYGCEYRFTGDVAFENKTLLATFSSINGAVRINVKPNKVIAELVPTSAAKIREYELIRNAADEVVLSVNYDANNKATFTFGKNEIVEVQTSSPFLKIVTPIEHAIIPGFVGDDIIYSPSSEPINVASDKILLGLLRGEDSALVLTWTDAHNHVQLASNEVKLAGKGAQHFFLSALSAPGIWHREPLTVDHLEKDAAINWKPPFRAKWQTQLIEGTVKTTFAFRNTKGTVWRGVPGSYNYPVWFDGDKPTFSLSKKVPPKGEAIIYFLEGHDTPPEVLTPVDFLKATLGRQQAAAILDVEGRKLRTHHGPSGSNVHRACTCGYTEAIQAVFEKGEECDNKNFIVQSLDDMMYFVREHLDRIDEYRKFATELTEYLQAKAKSNPELKDYLEDLDATVQQIPAEYENQKENMKSLEHAAELQKMTLALTARKEADNLKRYMELVKAWRAMGGAQDYVVAQYHTLTRKLFQDASYNATSNPKAAELAQEIRARCKKILRNPDGYEIWPNY